MESYCGLLHSAVYLVIDRRWLMVDITTFRLQNRPQKRFFGFSKLIWRTNSFDFILYNCSMPAIVCVLCYLGQKLRNRSLISAFTDLQACERIANHWSNREKVYRVFQVQHIKYMYQQICLQRNQIIFELFLIFPIN